MNRLSTRLGTFLKYMTLICCAAFVSMVLLQIVARFAFTQAPSWTEEAARMLFVYTISFAAGLGLRARAYVSMDLLYNRLPEPLQKGVDLLNDVLVVLLFGLMLAYSFSFIELGLAETSPSLRVPMAIPFAATTVMAACMVFFGFLDVVNSLNRLRP